MQSVLFFLWSSAVSILLLFWASAYLGLMLLTSDMSLVEIFYEFLVYSGAANAQSNVLLLVGSIFFLSVMLNTAVAPLQLWVVTFYNNLPMDALFLYFVFYYLYFLTVVLSLLFGHLYALSSLWYLCTISLLLLTTVHTLFNLTEATTLRGFFAYSSVINIFIVFIYSLSVL